MPATVVTLDARGEPPWDASGQELANVAYLAVRDCPAAIQDLSNNAIGVSIHVTGDQVEMAEILPGTKLTAESEACLRERVGRAKAPALEEPLVYQTFIALPDP